MGKGIIVFAGTSEGRRLYEFCEDRGIRSIFCVATEYGKQVLCKEKDTGSCHAGSSGPDIRSGRMDEEEMLALFEEEKPVMIIDATHPYAAEVTENIRKAAKEYRKSRQIQEKVYYRVLRSLTEAEDTVQGQMAYQETYQETYQEAYQEAYQEEDPEGGYHTDTVYCADMKQAVSYLDSATGNILVTTGSGQIGELCKLKNYADRVWLRILPDPDILRECLDRGFRADHIICMQGPFSEDMNTAMLRGYNICYFLTKQSGKTGGYPQKAAAAEKCGVRLVVILPPQEADGVSLEEMKTILAAGSRLACCPRE